jgi:preprotein translocase subunit SecE
MNKIVKFFQESYAELKKVTWPTKEAVGSSTKVVLVSIIIVAVALGLIDYFLYEIMNYISSM